MSAVAVLLVVGMVMMGSIERHPDWSGLPAGALSGLLLTHVLGAVVGLLLLCAVARTDYRRWRPFAIPFASVVFMLLLLVLLPGMGPQFFGIRKWLYLAPGMLFQPSLLAGPALVLFMAWWYAPEPSRSPYLFWIPFAVLYGLAVLVFAAPDFSMALFIMMTGGAMMILGGERLSLVASCQLLPLGGTVYLILRNPLAMARMNDFLGMYPREIASLPAFVMALREGGWAGVGLGSGEWTRCFLREASGGLVTAVIGEQLGLLAVLMVTGLFVVVTVSGARIASHAPDRFGALLGSGWVCMLAIQFLLNMSVVTWQIPMKVVPLPLVSHGALSLAVALVGVGVLLNIARTRGDQNHE